MNPAVVGPFLDLVLLGEEASEGRLAAVLRERERWRAVHLACHGLLDQQNPAFSALV